MRAQLKVDIPDEWMENLKHGRCWCGKDHTQFEKGQKFYCSKEHALEYDKRIVYWTHFKDAFLEKNGRICTNCGLNHEQNEKDEARRAKEHYQMIADSNPEALKAARAYMLKELQAKYEQIMDDAHVMEHIPWEVKNAFDINHDDTHYQKNYFSIEVDHKIAVCLGGDMWDENNLQALCYKCHKEKTKEDMKKLKESRKQ